MKMEISKHQILDDGKLIYENNNLAMQIRSERGFNPFEPNELWLLHEHIVAEEIRKRLKVNDS